MLTEITQKLPGITSVYAPNDASAMFSHLVKLKESGTRINFLVIAGHGSAANPHIAFSGGDLSHEDVDLPKMRKNLASYEKASQNSGISDQTKGQHCQKAKELKDQIKYLESISEVMTDNAVVMLLNCSTAATAEGETFVKNLGEVLLSKKGGTIIASKNDLEMNRIDEKLSFFHRAHAGLFTGKPTVVGDHFFAGDFVGFPVRRVQQQYKIVANNSGTCTSPTDEAPSDIAENTSEVKVFRVTPGQWHSTGIQLKQGQSFQITATGKVTRQGDREWGPGGYYLLGYMAYSLKAMVGKHLFEIGAGGGGVAPVDGELRLGITWTYAGINPDDSKLQGGFNATVTVEGKR